jgi:hypothetical protein
MERIKGKGLTFTFSVYASFKIDKNGQNVKEVSVLVIFAKNG